MIGKKIKELRQKNCMTQKDLADKLFVTGQAVSRWENDEVEPSLDTIKQMAKIFNVTIDELVGDQKEEIPNEDAPVEEVPQEEKPKEVVKEYVYMEPVKESLAQCSECYKKLYKKEDIFKYTFSKRVGSGRGSHLVDDEKILCRVCYEKQLELDEQARQRKEKARVGDISKRRVWSIVVGIIVFAIFLGVAIFQLTEGNTQNFIINLVLAVCGYTFAGCFILFNNFIPEMWVSIATWSIKLPGVIFTLDLDGIVWFLTIKLLGALLSIAVTIFCVLLATALGFALSVLVYPFALGKSIRNIE